MVYLARRSHRQLALSFFPSMPAVASNPTLLLIGAALAADNGRKQGRNNSKTEKNIRDFAVSN
jgi:hypothetical protein